MLSIAFYRRLFTFLVKNINVQQKKPFTIELSYNHFAFQDMVEVLLM